MILLRGLLSSESGWKITPWIVIGFLLYSSLRASWLLLCNPMPEEPILPLTLSCLGLKLGLIIRRKSQRNQLTVSTSMAYLYKVANVTSKQEHLNNPIPRPYLWKCLLSGWNLCKSTCMIQKILSTSALSTKPQQDEEHFRQQAIQLTSWCIWQLKQSMILSTGCVGEWPCYASWMIDSHKSNINK